MADIGLEAVFSDQHNGKARSAAGELRHVQSVALAVGNEDNVARTECRHGSERLADLSPSVGAAQLADLFAPAVRRSAPEVANLIVELPEMEIIARAQLRVCLAEAEQGGGVLGEPGVGRAQLAHGSRTVDDDGSGNPAG